MHRSKELPGFLGDERLRMLLLAVLVGLLAGLLSVSFHMAIGWLWRLAQAPGDTGVGRALLRFAAPVAGLSLSGWLLAKAGETSEATPQVMELVAEGGARIPGRVGAVKTLAAWVTLGCGGSAGREGPSVMLGATVGSVVGKRLGLGRASMQLLVGCGAAAAIAASFNAPIAAVLFTMEVVLGAAAMRAFTPLVVSSVTATIVGRALVGNHPAFIVPAYSLGSVREIPTYVVLGLVAGLGSRLFVSVIHSADAQVDRLGLPTATRWALAGAIVGLGALVLPEAIGNGYATIGAAFHDQHTAWVLVGIVVLKPLLTGLTLAGGGMGGTFAPSLVQGAALGALVGSVSTALFPAWTGPVGAYSLVGMAALLAGTTHAPIMAILFVFELTGDYGIILPVMLASVLSTLVSSGGGAESIFTTGLVRRGTRLRRGHQAQMLGSRTAGDLMRPPPLSLHTSSRFDDVVRRLLEGDQDYVYLSDDQGVLSGVISLSDVRTLLRDPAVGDRPAGELMSAHLRTATAATSLTVVASQLDRLDLERLPVVDGDGHLVGVVLRRDVLAMMNRGLLVESSLGIEFVSGAEDGGGAHRDFIEVPPDHRVEVVPVPAPWVGHSLADLGLRSRYGVNVVAVRRQGARGVVERIVPDPGLALTKGELLVVTGADADLRRLAGEVHPGPREQADD